MMSSTIASSENRMIFGLGITGRSVARWWRRQNMAFTAVDTREELADEAANWPELVHTPTRFGELPPELAEDVTEMIVSPGVPLEHPLVVRARDQGCRVRGDIDLFMQAVQAPVVGITGSNGKSTVTSLLGEMMSACGRSVSVGGNLGRPALDLLDDQADLYVLELSSFQLERAEALGLSVAAVLNVSADHLDRYPSMPAYHRAKHRIFMSAAQVVANRQDPLTVPLMSEDTPVTWWSSRDPDLGEFGLRDVDGVTWICCGNERLMACTDLLLVGRHNYLNVVAALAMGVAMGLSAQDLLRGACAYKGLPHRCQFVADVGGIRFIDDSKGTNIGATLAALEGLATGRNVWLIMGGQGKGQDFSLLRDAVGASCAGLLLIGEASEDIARCLGDVVQVAPQSTLEDAVKYAAAVAQPGEVVLLSPACASFDMFRNYVERGEHFQSAVALLEAAA